MASDAVERPAEVVAEPVKVDLSLELSVESASVVTEEQVAQAVGLISAFAQEVEERHQQQLAHIDAVEHEVQILRSKISHAGLTRPILSSSSGLGSFGRVSRLLRAVLCTFGFGIAEEWVRLIDGDLDAPLEVDEWGEIQNNGECGNVWTNTMRDGVPYDEDACTGWTSLTDATRLGRSDVSRSR